MIKYAQELLGVLLHAPRGPFYSPKAARSRWRPTRKAELAFCRVVHRTVQCTTEHPLFMFGARSPSISSASDHCSSGSVGAPDTVRCTPDSPVNFSRTPSANARERPLRPRQPGAPDTVRCTTGHCPVHHRTVRCPRPKQPLGCTQPSLLFSSSICF